MDKVNREFGLPFGGRGLASEDFFVQFQGDKIVFGSRTSTEYYTLEFGSRSGIIDLHKTYLGGLGNKIHEPVGAIEVKAIPKLAEELSSPLIDSLKNLVRRTSIGWFSHRNIGIVKGPYSNERDLNKVLRLGKKKRLIVDKQLVLDQIEIPEYLDDVFEYPDGMFRLISCRRRRTRGIGFLYKVTLPDGTPHLFWVKDRDLTRFGRQCGDLLLSKLKQYALPPDAVQKWLEGQGESDNR